MPIQPAQQLDKPFPGQQPVDQQRNRHAHAGINHAGNGVADIGIHRRIEQDDAQHHAARLHRARPVEYTAAKDQDRYAGKQEQQHGPGHMPIRIKNDVEAEQQHAHKAADDGAEEAVAAVEPGIAHAVAHTENRADTGEGGIAIHQEVNKRAQRGCQRRFDIPLSYMQVQMMPVNIHRNPS